MAGRRDYLWSVIYAACCVLPLSNFAHIHWKGIPPLSHHREVKEGSRGCKRTASRCVRISFNARLAGTLQRPYIPTEKWERSMLPMLPGKHVRQQNCLDVTSHANARLTCCPSCATRQNSLGFTTLRRGLGTWSTNLVPTSAQGTALILCGYGVYNAYA